MKNEKLMTLVFTAIIAALAVIAFIYLKHENHSHLHTDEHQHEEISKTVVTLSDEAIKENKIKIEEAGSVDFKIKLNVMGKIAPNEEHTAHMSPRYAGIAKAVNKKLGDQVKKGDVLAVIESNESLQNYNVQSEISGTIIKKNINLGMNVTGQEPIFVIADLNSVWADFNIYSQDLKDIHVGNAIEITNLNGTFKQEATIAYISPFGNENTQSVVVRAVLPNSDGYWKPGLFVSGEIATGDREVLVAVKDSALQTYNEKDVVFLVEGNKFEAVPVTLGKRNKEWVEIKSGLKPKDKYVSENSFILKADLEKSGASHEH